VTEQNNYIEKESTEVVRTYHESDGQTNNTVNVEQNINVISIDMGKRPLLEQFDLEGKKKWIQEHMPLVIAGGILVLYTVILVVMGATISKYRALVESLSENEVNTDVVEAADVPSDGNAVTQIAETKEVVEIEQVTPEETKQDYDEIEVVLEEPEEEEIPTEKALYDFLIVGDSKSSKMSKAVNTVGEELEDVFYLTGGFYSETVGFYLNGEYERFTANISCDENCKGGFNVNIYLDDGPCEQTIRVERLMSRTPIDIDTTGATFIKFEITGSMYAQGALLSDGILYIDEAAETAE
jgi:hypothetical protein